MKATRFAVAALSVAMISACSDQAEVTGPGPSMALVAVPAGPNPAGEQIVVCKVGGSGTYDFTYTGGAAGNFSLQPGECWHVGYFGGAGVSIDITETPRAGHEVVSITVDQLNGADQNVTGTNTVTGVLASGSPAQSALVVFTNRVLPPPPGDEGCTPGYWKTHDGSGPQSSAWGPSGYAPGDLFSGVFSGYTTLSASLTLTGALNGGGGGGIAGAEKILARAAVAALLNASHTDVNYPMSEADVISQVDAAFATQNRNTMLALAETLDIQNNLGCPLN